MRDVIKAIKCRIYIELCNNYSMILITIITVTMITVHVTIMCHCLISTIYKFILKTLKECFLELWHQNICVSACLIVGVLYTCMNQGNLRRESGLLKLATGVWAMLNVMYGGELLPLRIRHDHSAQSV